MFNKKAFVNTAIVLLVSTIISFYQFRPAYQFHPISQQCLGFGALRTSFRPIGTVLKDLQSHKISREPCFQFLHARSHFMQNFQLDKMFYLNIRTCHQLGVSSLSKSQFWPNFAKKTYQAVTPEPYFQFSQANTHFIQNPEENLKEHLKYQNTQESGA